MALINVWQGNTKTCSTTVSGLSSLSGYTAKLNISDLDGVEQFEVSGTINGLDVSYVTSNVQNYLTIGDYVYEAYIYNGSKIYTLDKGIWKIHATVKSHSS